MICIDILVEKLFKTNKNNKKTIRKSYAFYKNIKTVSFEIRIRCIIFKMIIFLKMRLNKCGFYFL